MKAGQLIRKYGDSYFFLSFWLILFFLFTLLPILAAAAISFTNFDMVQMPRWIGAANYLRMLLDDDVFVKALINTVLFAVITGPAGYAVSFVVGWLINDLGRGPRTVLTFLFYSPSLVGASYLVWTYFFSGDSYGLVNSFLIRLGVLSGPLQWLSDPSYNFAVVVVVVLWGSMGAGFLSFVAGFQSLNRSYFEAGAIDGIRNRWQELWYITLPQMSPQLLIGAVLSISGAFAIGAQNAALTGFPSTDYSTHTLVLHIQDYGSNRLEMGYASAVAVVLFLLMTAVWTGISRAIQVFSPD